MYTLDIIIIMVTHNYIYFIKLYLKITEHITKRTKEAAVIQCGNEGSCYGLVSSSGGLGEELLQGVWGN